MGPGALSNPSSRKNRKNNSEERRKKKKKIKTTKIKKRRHDSSSSSSSGHSSSDSEDNDSRAPKKSSRNDPKKPRLSSRRKKSRGRDKGKRENTRSRRRDDSVSSMSSYSSRSCSTCRDRSRSPDEIGSERLRRLGHRGPKVKLSIRGRSRGRAKERERRKNSREVVYKRNSSKYHHRSLSCSSSSKCSHSRSISSGSHHSKERFLEKKRLRRSQLAIKGTEKKSKETLRRHHISEDENREEIIQDYDDLPSSRSNGSYDGGRKRETGLAPLAFHPHALENKRYAEDSGVMRRADDDAHREEVSSANVFQLAENACDGDRFDPMHEFLSDKVRPTRLKSVISVHTSSPEADDVELLLRQKALENFRKFRREPSANTKSLGDLRDDSTQMEPCSVGSQKTNEALMHPSAKPVVIPMKKNATKSPCSTGSQKMDEVLLHPSAKPVVIPVKKNTTNPCSVGSCKTDEALLHLSAKPVLIPVKKKTTKSPCSVGSQKSDEALMHPSAKPVVIPVKKNTTKSLEHQRHAHDGSYPTDSRDKSVANRLIQIPIIDPVQENHANKLDGCPNNRTSSKMVVGSVVSDPVHSSHKYQDTPNQLQKLKESSEKMLEKTSGVKIMSDSKSATKPGSSGTYKVEVDKADGSSSGASRLNPEIGEHNSNEPKLEGRTGSEFEQKTMSVMRGGEMVQVSYKVYIPKKTPALARRQLQR